MAKTYPHRLAAVLVTGLISLPLIHSGAAAASKQTQTRIKEAAASKVSGAVRGAGQGRTRITIAGRKNGGWKTVRRSLSSVKRSGRFAITYPNLPPGTYQVKAQYLGSPRARQSRSKPKRITVPQGCALPRPNQLELGSLTLPQCAPATLIKSDDSTAADPSAKWGNIECASAGRHGSIGSGGDTHLGINGQARTETAFRRLSVLDGDDFYGERCELGVNDHRDGSFHVYREGNRAVTFASVRLPSSFPLTTSKWQTILQMKQTQPSAAGGGAPALEVQAFDGKMWLVSRWNELWTVPIATGGWMRIALDVSYSQDPGKAHVRMHVDANGDGDANDAGERSPTFRLATLIRETKGGWSGDGIRPGASIPSHARIGVYHDPSIACPPPGGCSVDVDNVEIVGAN